MAPLQTSVPQQSLSALQASPEFAQPHVPALQMLGAQQSLLPEHDAPAAWQAHVMELVSQRSTPQQSRSVAHVCPLVAHAPPSGPPPPERQVLLAMSHVKPVQHAGADGSQSPPCPAQAAWHFPWTQLPEQQSPSALQHDRSFWQLGSDSEQPPPLLEDVELLPLLELELFPLLELLLLVVPPLPHLPAVHESEQHCAKPEHATPRRCCTSATRSACTEIS